MKKCPSGQVEAAGAPQEKARDAGATRRRQRKKKTRNVISAIVHNMFVVRAHKGDGRGRGPSMRLAQTDSDIQY
eukprot:4856886-Pyramimonas_sp.AAC.1